ncbi:MarR family winged helix-turn-helix transcriptional regulator [Glaciihabitans tibetensis]|uniref:MarR family winged helix-turn-helix transcriptional regulator n=1 Tax=Glaciihabitans tibetensis TaxID=1266600 RepID=UPI0015E66CE7|nr:MarR family transcriptional regulator [Glaciihabitans tibetensis]
MSDSLPPRSHSDARYSHLVEVEQAVSLLHQLSRAKLRVLVERFDADLQPAGFAVLRCVVANSPIRSGDIASALGIDKSAVSRQLTILRDAGLIDATPDPADGRATLVVATDAALVALKLFREDVRAEYERILDSWETEEIVAFGALLQKFNTSLS